MAANDARRDRHPHRLLPPSASWLTPIPCSQSTHMAQVSSSPFPTSRRHCRMPNEPPRSRHRPTWAVAWAAPRTPSYRAAHRVFIS